MPQRAPPTHGSWGARHGRVGGTFARASRGLGGAEIERGRASPGPLLVLLVMWGGDPHVLGVLPDVDVILVLSPARSDRMHMVDVGLTRRDSEFDDAEGEPAVHPFYRGGVSTATSHQRYLSFGLAHLLDGPDEVIPAWLQVGQCQPR